MWGRRKKPVEVPDDTGEAQVIRDEAAAELHELRYQGAEIRALVRRLERRRQQNHFGEELSVSFKPRGGTV